MKLLKSFWEGWKKVAKIIGNFQAQVLFTIFYFTIILPVGIGVRFFSDPLNTSGKNKKTNFNTWEHPAEDVAMARKPY